MLGAPRPPHSTPRALLLSFSLLLLPVAEMPISHSQSARRCRKMQDSRQSAPKNRVGAWDGKPMTRAACSSHAPGLQSASGIWHMTAGRWQIAPCWHVARQPRPRARCTMHERCGVRSLHKPNVESCQGNRTRLVPHPQPGCMPACCENNVATPLPSPNYPHQSHLTLLALVSLLVALHRSHSVIICHCLTRSLAATASDTSSPLTTIIDVPHLPHVPHATPQP
ncbi:hypothetical protein CC85DRAFT_195475 [Cutaneotrichosporon oleaginosum]|uniref:Secreted protein n=1 Tax=Cutaneotrichosporon oleaginosum TaxID=879819 RepID=A0A0J0XEF8_9TREE|nr:uncharacterized protein CC85DRAFT_195475 [Cutaneotrichosporon oleaginosum]KLT39460.1 hypothetical protein CC85DRAFT_195475 [Cutaneotrichosporon oleaginosum]TXT09967.1 hypothetical protein COLE_03901 [Cutaneotrichosporon oleaginosum]